MRTKASRHIKVPLRLWNLEDVLPHVIKQEEQFSDLVNYRVLKKFNINTLVKEVGEAALLFLCHRTLIPAPDQLMTNSKEEIRLVQRAFYEHIIQTIFEYEKSRRLPERIPFDDTYFKPKKMLKVSKDPSGKIKYDVEIVKIDKSKEHSFYDKVIKTSDIHKKKEVDMKRAIPIRTEKPPKKVTKKHKK